MKRLIAVVLFIAGCASGQDETHVVDQIRTVKILPVFQSWKSDPTGTISEFSIPVEFYYPFNREWSVNVTTGQASAAGKNLTSVAGLSDIQTLINYYLESSNLVLSLGMNLPSGKKELKIREFNTTALLSQNMLRFETPVLGQGFNLAPGLTWAWPVSETVVLGFGTSYQIKGGYKPIEKMSGSYKPGNEWLITAGLDARTGETGSISADLIWTLYQADQLGDTKIFRAGGKIMAAVQYRKYIGRDLLHILARYRSRSKNHVILAGTSTEKAQIQPDDFEFSAFFRRAVSTEISLNVSAEIRVMQKTEIFNRITILELGAGPDWEISPSVKIPMRLKFDMGKFESRKTLTGFETGIGLEYQF